MNAFRGFRALASALVAVALLAGCSALELRPKPMAFYDLGLGPAAVLPAALSPLAVDVNAAPWLGASVMQYRLNWNDPDRRRAYSEARWASPPAEMLHVTLQRGLNVGAGGIQCRLHVDLYEFHQLFESATESSVEVVLRAGLLRPRSDKAFAAREFRVREAAPSADAVGGVTAYRAAGVQLVSEIAAWIIELDREAGQGLNMVQRCGS